MLSAYLLFSKRALDPLFPKSIGRRQTFYQYPKSLPIPKNQNFLLQDASINPDFLRYPQDQ